MLVIERDIEGMRVNERERERERLARDSSSWSSSRNLKGKETGREKRVSLEFGGCKTEIES